MQKRGCRGQAAARLRAAGGLLELGGDRLVGPRCGCGQMPRATVGVDAAVGRLRQRQMDRAPVLRGRRSVHRRAHQRMAEHHPLADREQPVGLRVRGRGPMPSRSARATAAADRRPAPPPRSAADAACRRRALEPSDEALLDPPCQAPWPRRPKPPASCVAVKPRGQLEQRQRVPARLGDDPVPDSLIQLEPHRRAEQRAGVALRTRAPPARAGAEAPRPARGRRRRSRPDPPAGAGRRRRGSAPRPDPATARHRRRRPTDARSAASANRPSAAKPTRNLSGAPQAQAEHDLHGLPLRPGSRSSPSNSGPHN